MAQNGGGKGGGKGEAYAALATQAFGLLGQVAGSFYSAKSQRTQADLQAYLARHNARMSELAAKQSLAAGQKRAGQRSLQAGYAISQQKAQQAAAGVDLSVGSAAETRAGTELFKEADLQQIEANALMEAWGYRSQAADYEGQAAMARATRPQLAFAAGMTLLNGAGQVAQSWYALSKSGALQGRPSEKQAGDDPIYGLYMLNGGWKK